MLRWFLFILSILIGIAAALYLGWVVLPAQNIEASPDTLRQDYKTDYVLMVAESYQQEREIDPAIKRIQVLGERPPAAIVAEAILYARTNDWPDADLSIMESLGNDLSAHLVGTEAPAP